MSRSNPNENAPNPASRWFEWNGEKGEVRYYDKEAGARRDVPLPFTFLLLDQLGSVRGWDDASGSGIYSNLVKDTRKDVLVVKSFKGGVLATGVYKAIKDRVNALGGRFNAICYVAFKNDEGNLSIGAVQFKGAALRAWMEFTKKERADIYKKAVTIHGTVEGKKGRVTFFAPEMRLVSVSADTNTDAAKLDKELQDWLATYLARNTTEQAESAAHHVSDEDIAAGDGHAERSYADVTDDDIPF